VRYFCPMTLNSRISVIGLGSPIMTDDSVGLRLAQRIQDRHLPDTDVRQEAVGGLDILPCIRGYSYTVIVDAIQTGKYGPGTVLIFDVADFEDTVRDVPAHDINLATAIRIGRQMDPDSMPCQVKFVAVEIADMQTMSEELTPAVAGSLDSAEKAVLHVIKGFQTDREQRSAGKK